MEEKRRRRRYTKEFKMEAVKLVKERDGRVTEVANNLGIHPVMLHR
jgi:transposase-like protein